MLYLLITKTNIGCKNFRIIPILKAKNIYINFKHYTDLTDT